MNSQEVEYLEARARSSPGGEVYALAAKRDGFRVGACASVSPSGTVGFAVEVLVQLCPSTGLVDLEVIERRLRTVKELEDEGFELRYEGDWCVSCQMWLKKHELPGLLTTEVGRMERMV